MQEGDLNVRCGNYRVYADRIELRADQIYIRSDTSTYVASDSEEGMLRGSAKSVAGFMSRR